MHLTIHCGLNWNRICLGADGHGGSEWCNQNCREGVSVVNKRLSLNTAPCIKVSMADNPLQPQIPRIEYVRPETYQIHPVTGVYGGANTRNDGITVHWFLEYMDVPKTSQFQPPPPGHPPGVPIQLTEVPQVTSMRRDLKVGMTISPEQALSVGQWLVTIAQGILAQRRPPNA